MTDAQIEAIARAYCVKLGLDPDASLPNYNDRDSGNYIARWRLHAIAMQEAIAEVLGEKATPPEVTP